MSKVVSAERRENAEGAEHQDNILFLTRRTYVFSAHISLWVLRALTVSLRSLLKMLDNSVVCVLFSRFCWNESFH
jgi:hypothetical protein